MAAARCPCLALTTLLVLLACSSAADDNNLTHFQFYFHEVRTGAPNETSVLVASQYKNGTTFGDLKVFDNALREGADPSSLLIGRARGLGVTASLDNSGALTTIEFVFSDYGMYTGSTMATVGHFIMTDTAERSIVGGTGMLRFARGCSASHAATSQQIIVFEQGYLVALIDIKQ
ncbi:hypothetical protein U9M48_034212 [Paspalum notatum var. saurae]|uniref:Dirigent protein n=1 Tax=Paspalum notatum var. saurae TaxID=547442 RepID=A0AAQ3U9D6_PASNO